VLIAFCWNVLADLDTLLVVHHILIIIAFSLGVYVNIGTYYMSAFLVNEVSTIFLNFNYILAVSKWWKESSWYRLNAMLLLQTFFVTRVVFNLYNVWHLLGFTWYHTGPAMWAWASNRVRFLAVLLSSLAIGHVIINLVWFRKIVIAARRKLGRPRTKDSSIYSSSSFSSSPNDNGVLDTTGQSSSRSDSDLHRRIVSS